MRKKTNQFWWAKLSITICSAAGDDDDDAADDDDVSAMFHVARHRYSATTDWPRRRPRDDDVTHDVSTSSTTVKRYWPERSRHVTPSSQSGNLQDDDGQLTRSTNDQTVNEFTIL